MLVGGMVILSSGTTACVGLVAEKGISHDIPEAQTGSVPSLSILTYWS